MICNILLIFFALLNTNVFSLPHNSGLKPRIVNGLDAKPGQFPYSASISSFNGQGYDHICNGVIVGQHWILTAGLCCEGLEKSEKTPQVIVGTNILNEAKYIYNIEKITLHPKYNHTTFVTFVNDLCLVELSEDLEKSEFVHNITLASHEDDFIEDVTISGWGLINEINPEYPKGLQFLETTVVPNEKCDRMWSKEEFYYPITEEKLCTSTQGQKGFCGRDNGGPLIVKDQNNVVKLVGIASYNDHCATGMPDVYTRISKYVDWINSVIKK